MKPKHLAHLTCANWKPGEICAGVQITKRLSLFVDPELAGKPCCVDKKPCTYFERIIIQAVFKHTGSGEPQLQQMKMAVAQYELKVMKLPKVIRRCKQCQKPTPKLKPNEKFCADCKQKKKQESWRKAKRRSRCPQSAAVSEVI